MKIVLEETCFQRDFKFSKNISFLKKTVEDASKTEISSEDLTSIWELHESIRDVDFGTLVLALHC